MPVNKNYGFCFKFCVDYQNINNSKGLAIYLISCAVSWLT